jgi:hypothetical protein
VADHLIPNRILGFFEFLRGKRERGGFCFQGLAKASMGADSRSLKTSRFAAYIPRQFHLVHEVKFSNDIKVKGKL